MKHARLVAFPGDGIGPEVMEEGYRVLSLLKELGMIELEVETFPIGGASLDRFGVPLTQEALDTALKADAVLLGAIGGPKWDEVEFGLRPEAALLELRKSLEVFCNLRPVKVFAGLESLSPIKETRIHGVDLLLVRELTSGLYFGKPKGIFTDPESNEPYGVNTLLYRKHEVVRLAKLGFELARARKGKVTNVDKANVLESSRFWRRVVEEVHQSFQGVKLDHLLVDAAAMRIILSPSQFDVLITTNMFGDILTDEAACIVGSIGLLPSASLGLRLNGLGERRGFYEPIHGSAPDITGKGLANPSAMILSVGMMLEMSLGEPILAKKLAQSVESVLKEGHRTKDLSSANEAYLKTGEFGDRVVTAFREALG